MFTYEKTIKIKVKLTKKEFENFKNDDYALDVGDYDEESFAEWLEDHFNDYRLEDFLEEFENTEVIEDTKTYLTKER